MERKPSFAVIYFGVGFTLAAGLIMLVLFFVRPLLSGASQGLRMALMLAPVVVGALYGTRVAMVGLRDDLRLGQALKRAFRG